METTEQTTVENNTQPQIDAAAVQKAISLMHEADYTVEETIEALKKRGYSDSDATTIVSYAVSRAPVTAKKSSSGKGITHIVIGVVLLIAGLALSGAGTGRIFIGAIVFGVVQIIRGIIALANND